MVRQTRPQQGVLNAVDMSNWGEALTASEAACMWERGVRLITVGSGHPLGSGRWSRQQLEQWLLVTNGRGLCGAYRYFRFDQPPDVQANEARSVLAGLPIYQWWADFEDDTAGGLLQSALIAYMDRALRHMDTFTAQRPTAIYTAEYWWERYLPLGFDRWNRRDLIDARYTAKEGAPPGLLYQPFKGREYGGWTEPHGYQYQGTTDLCGQSVDLLYYPNGFGPQEDGMSSQEFEQVMARIAKLEAAVVGVTPDGNSDTAAIAELIKNETYIAPRLVRLESTPATLPDHEHGGVKR